MTQYLTIRLRSAWPLSVRGPGDLMPRSSPIASLVDTPLLPRVETLLGLIAKTVIEQGVLSLDNATSNPQEAWRNVVVSSLIGLTGSHYIEVYGPFLKIGDKYYVDVGGGLLSVSKIACYVRDVGLELMDAMKVYEPLEYYFRIKNVKRRLESLIREGDLIYPPSMFMTGIALNREPKSVKHGLMYSYILRDYVSMNKGSYEILLVLKTYEASNVRHSLDETVVQLGPKGRPAKLTISWDKPSSQIARFTDTSSKCCSIGVVVSPTHIDARYVGCLDIVHPLNLKPIIIPLASSTKIRLGGVELWAKTPLKSALRPGTVIKITRHTQLCEEYRVSKELTSSTSSKGNVGKVIINKILC